MITYISANVAVARTRNARQSDVYIGEHKIFPGLIASTMEEICNATNEGKGSVTIHIQHYWFQKYSDKALEIGIRALVDKLSFLGYYVIKREEYVYELVWLSEGEE